MSPFKFRSGITGGKRYRQEVEEYIAHFVDSVQQSVLVFSAEGLSLLRHEDELAWLKSVLPAPTTVVAYLRQPTEYLAAYRYMIQKHGIAESEDPESVAYFGEDSWLLDYKSRLEPFRNAFGRDQVHVIDFDAAVARAGNVIPSFLRILAVDGHFEEHEWRSIILNRRPRD